MRNGFRINHPAAVVPLADSVPPVDRALVANLNVFTELDPRERAVRSWAWADGSADGVLAALERDARRTLRDVAGGDEIAARYVRGKRVLSGKAQGLRWLASEVRAARRVLVGAVPPQGRDRLLWAMLVPAALIARRPLLVYSETWLAPAGLRHAPRRVLDRTLARVATTILVPGGVHAEHYARLGHAAKVRRIAAPYPAPVRERRPVPDGREPELLFVGRPMPLKGLDRLLDLVGELDAAGERVRLVALLGDPGTQVGGDAAYAAGCLARLRARDPALTEVRETAVDVAPHYARATVLVAPNVLRIRDRVPGEAWGRVVVEALAAGLPVVSTDAVPSAVEHVVDGAQGTVVPWADDAALRAAVRGWLS